MVLENSTLIFSILVLVSFLGVLLYTAIVIKEEREAYRENAQTFSLRSLLFSFPSWWKESLKTDKLLRFEKGDWFAQFSSFPYSSLSGVEAVREIIRDRELVFDGKGTDIGTPYDLKDRPEIKDGTLEIVRIEGTATQYGETRVYYDIFLFKDHRNNQCILCESQSSVLSGMVEGPYFEEVVKNYRFTTAIP